MLHAFTDGRDTLPDSGAGYVAEAEGWLAEARRAAWRTRDRPLLRDGPRQAAGTARKLAYDALVRGRGRGPPRRQPARPRCSAAYERGETDEFVKPTLVGERGDGSATGDAVVFFNFRPDRARQLTRGR